MFKKSKMGGRDRFLEISTKTVDLISTYNVDEKMGTERCAIFRAISEICNLHNNEREVKGCSDQYLRNKNRKK